MHQHYKDILDRVSEPPSWFDDRGVSRFGSFVPHAIANIYASEAALAKIACQACGRLFHVALTGAFANGPFSLSDAIKLRSARYGDPPNVECSAGGNTMNSILLEVLEYWSRDHEAWSEWRRDSNFEGPFAGAPLSPRDTVAEVKTAVEAGSSAIAVRCSSARHRYDLVGRVTAALIGNGQILVAYPDNYSSVARKMVLDHIPETDAGKLGTRPSGDLI